VAYSLHNMAHIALQAKDVQKAADYWSEAWPIAMEIRDANGIFNLGRDFGNLLAQAGQKDAAKQVLTLAVQAGRAAGFPGVDRVEAMLESL
ncbi:MAG: hypothetical protein ACLFN9_14675, partial [Desulfococcaceae bacterium]